MKGDCNTKMDYSVYQISRLHLLRKRLCIALFVLVAPLFFHSNAAAQTITQDTAEVLRDTAAPDAPIFQSVDEASAYLRELLAGNRFRTTEKGHVLQPMFERLLDHYQEPFDSVRRRLDTLQFDVWFKPIETVLRHDTLPVRWLDQNTFIFDTVVLMRDPFITHKTVVVKPKDMQGIFPDSVSDDLKVMIDSIFQIRDTIIEKVIDKHYLDALGINIYRFDEGAILPPVITPEIRYWVYFLQDSTSLVLEERPPASYLLPDTAMLSLVDYSLKDSLGQAVQLLSDYTLERDSMLLYVSGADGIKTPFWITTGRDDLIRYWVKNERNDSITLWVGNPSHSHIRLVLEDAVRVRRPETIGIDDIPISSARPESDLLKIKPIAEIPSAWNYGFVSSLSLSQNHLSNWSKGGTSSFSGLIDFLSRANYVNKKTKVNWQTTGRLRYGTIRTKERGFQSQTDIVEVNSQYNRVYREKLDFSAVLYFKTQVAKGYSANNDSIPISKFLNPGTFTVGVGAEYKPSRNTRINFSPLSYRNTFVLDTANINQKAHGVEDDQRSRQEFGGQLVVRSTMTLMEDLRMTHAIRLFSNYLDKPQNIDIDWEMSLEKQINWYFTIRLNLHVIYDDDIMFAILDKNDEPVLWPDGTPKKGPRTQLNQFLGLTLSFRL